ncbi:organic solute transporter alpha-like protein 3 [Trichogramma pretiosum]|uniref:organic solute transporter alpha-like protein 3 n=1 Tax=Trichogramma pretiosum TaxID=7493 RepID=UPI0006C98A2A|nr:organic solute transporter alpha-like protein 3 [Trichogramma pretiosum]
MNIEDLAKVSTDCEDFSGFDCNGYFVPTTSQWFHSHGNFAIFLVVLGVVTVATTCYLAIRTCVAICFRTKETDTFKTNTCIIFAIYPIASLCSFIALLVPRTQLLAEALTLAALTIGVYRLYIYVLELASRKSAKLPPIELAGRRFLWFKLPEDIQSDNVYSWLRIAVLQLPLVQGLISCLLLFVAAESPSTAYSQGICVMPAVILSIVVGVFGLDKLTSSLEPLLPKAKLKHKTLVVKLVFVFSKLQLFILKGLLLTEWIPCRPPVTPRLHIYLAYNVLMLLEMTMLCYAASCIYTESLADNADVEGRDPPEAAESNGLPPPPQQQSNGHCATLDAAAPESNGLPPQQQQSNGHCTTADTAAQATLSSKPLP